MVLFSVAAFAEIRNPISIGQESGHSHLRHADTYTHCRRDMAMTSTEQNAINQRSTEGIRRGAWFARNNFIQMLNVLLWPVINTRVLSQNGRLIFAYGSALCHRPETTLHWCPALSSVVQFYIFSVSFTIACRAHSHILILHRSQFSRTIWATSTRLNNSNEIRKLKMKK